MANRLVSTEFIRRQQVCLDAVCRVLRKDGEHGTGFVIAHQLIITNNHVLPDEETSTESVAEFFNEKGMTLLSIKLDPKSFFVTSKTPGNINPPTKKLLDFTIVALQSSDHENLKKVYLAPLAIFKEIIAPQPGAEAFIIQHPKEGEDSSKKIPEGATKVQAVDEIVVHYNTVTKGGSSGGPVLNSERRLYALHRLGGCLQHGSQCNQGVLIQAIANFLREEKDRDGRTYFESLQAWITEKETSKTLAVSHFFFMANKEISQAREYFRMSKSQFEALDRKRVVDHFKATIKTCEEAIKMYYKQPLVDAAAQKEAANIQQAITPLKWQRMQLLLDLYLPLCLPDPEDKNHLLIRMLLEEEPLLALDEIVKSQEETVGHSSPIDATVLKPDEERSYCFFFAIIYEALKSNPALSGLWYLRLARVYLRSRSNIFWIRHCLDRAKNVDSNILKHQTYIQIDEELKDKEVRIKNAFHYCLQQLAKPTGKKPTCFILHDGTLQTKNWIKVHLLPALDKIGAQPIYDVLHNTKHLPTPIYNARNIQNANFVFSICTPNTVAQENEISSPVFFDLSMLIKKYPALASERAFAIMIEGNYAESIPFFFTSSDGNKIDASTIENYYLNSLKLFAKVTGKDDDLVDKLLERFQSEKKVIESAAEFKPSIPSSTSNVQASKEPSFLPPSITPKSLFAGPMPELLSRIPEIRTRKVGLEDQFDQANIVILTQPEDVLFKTGKTTLAREYVHSKAKKYERILWFDARNLESLKKSLQSITETFGFSNLFEFFNLYATWLLVFDGAINEVSLQDYLPKDILPAFSSYPKGMRRQVLITSRNRSWTHGTTIPVASFSDAECKICIKEITGKAPDEIEYRQIAAQVGGVPRRVFEFTQWVKQCAISLGGIKEAWLSKLHGYKRGLDNKSNIPFFNPEFIGRAEILAVIEDYFEEKKETPIIVSLHGLTGYGKTQIAAHFALVNIEKYPAICWIDCTNPDTIAFSYQQFAMKFKLPSGSNPRDAVKNFLNTQKSWLLIFDHLTSYEHLSDQLPTSYGHILISTSLPLDKRLTTLPLEVPILTLQEGTLLVMNAKQDAKQDIDESEARTCVETLKKHPLYLTLAIKYLVQTKQNIIPFLRALDDKIQGDPSQIPQFIFNQTWNKLSAEEIHFLKFCVGSNLVPLRREILKQWAELKDKNEIDVNSWLKNLKKYAILDFDSERVFMSPHYSERIMLSSSDKEKINEILQKLKS